MAEEWTEYDGGAVQERHWNARRLRVAPDVAVISEAAFMLHEKLRAVDLSNVTAISSEAFEHCHSLERVILSTASAVEIGGHAFTDCPNLEEIDLSNATKIGTNAFSHCHALRCVTIPSSVANIERAAFQLCNNLTDVKLCEGIQRIGSEAFKDCSSLVRISIPASVTDIGSQAFYGCSSLEEVELHKGLQHIGERAFRKCASLLRISIPSTTLTLGHNAFANCRQLRHVQLPEGLRTIGVGAFQECLSLEHISIPSSVTLIMGFAFRDCTSLSGVTLREGIHHILADVFDDCTSLAHIKILPVALVIDIGGSSCQLTRTAMSVTGESRLVVSKWLQYRGPRQLEQAEAKVNEILGRDGAGWEKIDCIRRWFAYYDLLDVTTMLELAIWRVNNDDNAQDSEARQANRINCGSDMNVIIPGVLQYLA